MKVTLTFPSEHAELIRDALGQNGSLEKQMVQIVLVHIGNQEIAQFKAKLEAESQLKVEAEAKLVSAKLKL